MTLSVHNDSESILKKGWHFHSIDNDIDGNTNAALITGQATGFAQLTGEDTIQAVSSDNADKSQTVTVTGINSTGKRVVEDIILNGNTAVDSAGEILTMRYIENAELDIECAGIITIQKKTGPAAIMTITIGLTKSGIAQHFNGEKASVITYFHTGVTTATGDIETQLRIYKDDADCLDAEDGYNVEDRFFIDAADTSGYSPAPHECKIYVPAGAWIAIYCISGAADADGYVTFQGYDTTK